MRIILNESAGLIIDIQEKLFPHIHKGRQLENNTRILVQGLKALDVPVLITEQYTKGLGFTIPGIKSLFTDANQIEKTSFSCCDEKEFEDQLQFLKKRNIIIAGIEAHVCVLQTTIDLINIGFQPVVVADCISSRKEADKEIAIGRMRQEGAIITTYESILFELTRDSRNSIFKEISKLVK